VNPHTFFAYFAEMKSGKKILMGSFLAFFLGQHGNLNGYFEFVVGEKILTDQCRP